MEVDCSADLLDRGQAAQLFPLLWGQRAQQAHGFLPLLHRHLLAQGSLHSSRYSVSIIQTTRCMLTIQSEWRH